MLQKIFGFDPDMEKTRLNRESKQRDSERMVPKAGPYFNPQLEDSLKKIALQTGIVTPSQVGLDLERKKPSEQAALDMKSPLGGSPFGGGKPVSDKTPGQPQQGRPKTSKDTQKRKTKEFSPQVGASLQLWAIEAQDKISELLNPHLLEFYGKKNMRSLSNIEYDEAEATKTKIFFSLEPLATITEDVVLSKLNTINSIDINLKSHQYNTLIKGIAAELNRNPTAEELKYSKAYFYQTVYCSK
jgi:hypothetical protein